MTKLKKTPYLTHFLFILMACALVGVLYLSVRDLTLSPAEQFEIAQTAERDGVLKKAERYYLMAASASNEDVSKIAAYYLGRLYRVGGENFPADGRRAEMFLEQAALQHVPQAQYELALMYDVGDKIPENRVKAIKWMNLAAQKGLSNALYGLGVWVERGYLGAPEMDKVIALYEQAAEQDNILAITSLIAIYSGGHSETLRNMEKATYWANKLAQIKAK